MEKIKKQAGHDSDLLSAYHLINAFTVKLKIKEGSFYSRINETIKFEPSLSGLSYNSGGLQNFEAFLKNYNKEAMSSKNINYTMPRYVCPLLRVLADIYEASEMLDKERTKRIFRAVLKNAINRHHLIRDLEGYVPQDVIGLPRHTMYSVGLMENLIDYLVGISKKMEGGGRAKRPL